MRGILEGMNAKRWHNLTEHAERFVARAAGDPDHFLLALDFDGTLAPLVPDPATSRMHEASAAALARIGPQVGQLAIITGRSVETVRALGRLDERAGLENLIVLGQYGVERFDAASQRVRADATDETVQQVRVELEELVERLTREGWKVKGTHIEDKGIAVGVHTRRAEDPRAAFELLGPLVTKIGYEHGLQVEPGRAVVELRASSRNKGDSLSDLAEEVGARSVAMVGDDLGDLPAFEVLATLRQQGVNCCAVVSSSDEQPQLAEVADVVCDGPDGVAEWLAMLADELSVAAVND